MTETTKKELTEVVLQTHQIAEMLEEEDYDPTEVMVVSYEWFSDLQDKLSRYTHLGYHPVMHVPCPQHHLRHAIIMRKFAEEKTSSGQSHAAGQRTAEWDAQRAGKPTASRFGDVMAVSKKTGKPLESRRKYMLQLVAERIAGPIKGPQTAAMRRGIELEPYVLELYTKKTEQSVEAAPFVLHESGLYGASPDGFIGDDGLVEVKTSEPHIFITDITESLGGIPDRFRWQMIGQCLVTDRKWCDLAQYSESLNSLYIMSLVPSQEELDQLHTALVKFNGELSNLETQVRGILENMRIEKDE